MKQYTVTESVGGDGPVVVKANSPKHAVTQYLKQDGQVTFDADTWDYEFHIERTNPPKKKG